MVTNFIPTLWSALLNAYLMKGLVYGNPEVSNRGWEGAIREQGDVIKIFRVTDVDVLTYNRNVTDISYQTLTTEMETLEITQSKHFAFQLDDVDAAQVRRELIGPQTKKASYNVKDVMDAYYGAKFAEEAEITAGLGLEESAIQIDEDNVWEILTLVAQAMDDAKVPRAGRWIIIPPWLVRRLVLRDATLRTENSEVLKEGFVGRYAGFNIFMSLNTPKNDYLEDQVIAGIPEACTVAEPLTKLEAIRLEKRFSDGIRGLFLYDCLVNMPEAVAMLTCEEVVAT